MAGQHSLPPSTRPSPALTAHMIGKVVTIYAVAADAKGPGTAWVGRLDWFMVDAKGEGRLQLAGSAQYIIIRKSTQLAITIH